MGSGRVKSSLFSMLFLSSFLCVLVLASATPNQDLDAIIRGANKNIRSKGWCTSQRIQSALAKLPMSNDNGGNVDAYLNLDGMYMPGVCDLRRSKSASFDDKTNTLCGSIVAEGVQGFARYSIQSASSGVAQSGSSSGTA